MKFGINSSSNLLTQLAVAVLYLISGLLIHHFIISHGIVSIVWPGSGIALAALLIGGKRYLWAIALGAFVLNMLSSHSPWIILGFTLANVLEAYLGWWLLTRHTNAPFQLNSLKNYLRLIGIGGATASIPSALIGALSLLLASVISPADYFYNALHWWMGDTLGIVLLAPFILTWQKTPAKNYISQQKLESLLLVLSAFIVGQIAFLGWLNQYFSHIYTSYFAFMVVTWVAIRLNIKYVTLVTLMMAFQALLGAYLGMGTFQHDIANAGLTNYWNLMLILSVVSVSLATYVNQVKQKQLELKERELYLLAIIASEPECIKVVDQQGRLIQMNPAGLAMIEADSLAQVLNHEVIDLVAPEHRANFMQLHQDVLAGQSVTLQFEVIGLKGRRRWMETRAVPLLKDGKTVQLAVTHDITDSKHVEEQLRLAATTFEISEAIMITDVNANIIRVNQAFTAITGYSEAEVMGKNPRIFRSGKHDESFYAAKWQALHSTGVWSGEVWDKHKNGSIYPTQQTITAVKNSLGETTQFVAIFANISERLKAEEEIRKTESHFVTILNSLDEIIWSASAPDFQLRHINAATEKLYGVPQQAFIEDPELWFKMIHPKDQQRVKSVVKRIFQLGKTETEYRIIRADGKIRWLSDRMYIVYDENHEPIELVGTVYDVTESKLAKDALQLSEQQAKQTLEALISQKYALDKHAIVAVTDVRGRITHANDKFCEISGYSKEELIGKDHAILNSNYHPRGFFKDMYTIVLSGKAWHDEVCNRAKDGHLYWVDTTIAPFMGADGKPQSYISIRTDITQRKAAEDRSNYLALYDTLTQLPNRRLLMDRLSQALASSARSGHGGALLFLDLDHFKTLNDTLGHDVGDSLLKQVAQRLTASVREGDTVARLGGDEFVVLLESLSKEATEAAAHTEEVGEKILAQLNQPYQLGTHEYQSTSSIGAALLQGHTLTVDELIKQADIAMYQAKQAGRNTLRFFDPEMQASISARVDLEHELHKALDKQQFQLHYQIQVDHTGKVLGAEALIRWLHPKRGMISPLQFIYLAEETGLILPIGKWVLETGCAQLKQWQQDPLTRDLSLSLNVSAKQFLQVNFVEQVQEIMQRTGIDPKGLKLELTESMLVDNVEYIVATMNTLAETGVRFSLDDFGTGYSSLQYLKKLPLNQLKIDQSFVRDIATDSSDRALVRTIIAMAHNLDMSVIAEGVETEEQRQFLVEYHCLNYQGYLFSKPVPIEQFENLLKKM